MKKLLEPLFICFSKIYIHFYEDKKDYWCMFPSLILATIFSLNEATISFYLKKVHGFNMDFGVLVPAFFIIFFYYLFGNIKYDYVKNYEMSKKDQIIVCLSIAINLAVNLIGTNLLKNGILSL